nr:MAG TPA: hypothetical protein [Caudoviricetes sp.]
MGQLNEQGIWNYSDNDIVQSWPVFMNLGFNSVSDVVKSLQKGRVIIAESTSDYNTKLAAIRKAGSGQFDVLVYRKDTKEFLINVNGQLTKISGGDVEVDYVNENGAFGSWFRYATNNNASVSRNITLPKAGVWLITPHITIACDGIANANNANIDVFCSINGATRKNVGTYNTYATNSIVPFTGSPIPVYANTPNKVVSVSVQITCSTGSNIGWGGLTIGAAKIG